MPQGMRKHEHHISPKLRNAGSPGPVTRSLIRPSHIGKPANGYWQIEGGAFHYGFARLTSSKPAENAGYQAMELNFPKD
jgi:hypothetical protein